MRAAVRGLFTMGVPLNLGVDPFFPPCSPPTPSVPDPCPTEHSTHAPSPNSHVYNEADFKLRLKWKELEMLLDATERDGSAQSSMLSKEVNRTVEDLGKQLGAYEGIEVPRAAVSETIGTQSTQRDEALAQANQEIHRTIKLATILEGQIRGLNENVSYLANRLFSVGSTPPSNSLRLASKQDVFPFIQHLPLQPDTPYELQDCHITSNGDEVECHKATQGIYMCTPPEGSA